MVRVTRDDLERMRDLIEGVLTNSLDHDYLIDVLEILNDNLEGEDAHSAQSEDALADDNYGEV